MFKLPTGTGGREHNDIGKIDSTEMLYNPIDNQNLCKLSPSPVLKLFIIFFLRCI